MSQSASGEEEELEMDYDQAVEKLNNMFPHISRAQIIDELTKAGICPITNRRQLL